MSSSKPTNPTTVPFVPVPIWAADWMIEKHLQNVPPNWRQHFLDYYAAGGPSENFDVYAAYNAMGQPQATPLPNTVPPHAAFTAAASVGPSLIPPTPMAKVSKRACSFEDALSPKAQARFKKLKQDEDNILSEIETDRRMKENELEKDVGRAKVGSDSAYNKLLSNQTLMSTTKDAIKKHVGKLDKMKEIDDDRVAMLEEEITKENAAEDDKVQAVYDKRARVLAFLAEVDKELTATEKEAAAKKEANKCKLQEWIDQVEAKSSHTREMVCASIDELERMHVDIQATMLNDSRTLIPAALHNLNRLLDNPDLHTPRHASDLETVRECKQQLESVQPTDTTVAHWNTGLSNFTKIEPEDIQKLFDVKTKADARRLEVESSKDAPFADILRMFKFLNEKKFYDNPCYKALTDNAEIMKNYPMGLPKQFPTCRTSYKKSEYQQMVIDFLFIAAEE